MGKNIAIFFDGTWNRSDSRYPTNVLKLAKAVSLTSEGENRQHVIYIPGIGTGKGPTRAARFFDRMIGGAFGAGRYQSLEEAYRHLIFSYHPGDSIFLFGFSRGAFLARSLAGLMRFCGIPDRENLLRVPAALHRYRSVDKEVQPDTLSSHKFRLEFSPSVTTSPQELRWRELRGYRGARALNIAYMGLWDTVGLYMSRHRLNVNPSSWLDGEHGLHDTSLSEMTKAARHAISIDDRRGFFAPVEWSNLARLNELAGYCALAPDRPYQQLWFPGDHGSVGGGGDTTELSDRTLHWVAGGAEAAGLRLDAKRLPALPPINPYAPLRNRKGPNGILDYMLGFLSRDRSGPLCTEEIAEETIRRWCGNPKYRPRTLDHVSKALAVACAEG